MFTVHMDDGKALLIDADGFKTAESGQLVLYITDNDRNSTVFVAAKDKWRYFTTQ